MQQRTAWRTARKDKAAQRRQRLVVGVAGALESGDGTLINAQRTIGRVRRDRVAKVGTDVEELVLDLDQELLNLIGQPAGRDGHPDGAVRLVDVGVRGEPQIGLGCAAEVAKSRGAIV